MAVPEKKDRKRPLELIALSALLAIFIFVVVLMGTREALIALEFAGVGFIVGLVVLAMLALAARPQSDEQADITEQDDEQNSRKPRGH